MDNKDRIKELLDTLNALSEIQRNGQTIVNKELHTIIDALMRELKLKD